MKPNFLIIGVQKSGTTSIIEYFNQHPDIYMFHNEIHFFDTTKYLKGKKYYESLFKKKYIKNKKYIGEKTPSYSFIPFVIQNIYNMYPKMKLIMILREPIQRAFSQYMMVCKNLNIKPSNEHFYNTIKSIENIKLNQITSINGYFYLQRGFYDIQIQNIYKYFPKKQLYIGVFENIIQNQSYEYNKMFSFIGSKKYDKINYDTIYRKGNYEFELSFDNKKYLYQIYKKHNQKLYKILGYKIQKWENYYKNQNLL
jgi:hypothetical protein